MLILIVFWVALVLAVVSWIGAVAEDSSTLAWVALGFAVLAFLAAVSDGAAWL